MSSLVAFDLPENGYENKGGALLACLFHDPAIFCLVQTQVTVLHATVTSAISIIIIQA